MVLTVAHDLHIVPKHLNNTLNVCIQHTYKLFHFIADQCLVEEVCRCFSIKTSCLSTIESGYQVHIVIYLGRSYKIVHASLIL